ncbi:hypothetical protein [uncultured Salegentibacter sp.]|uniref:hypothetical protein n=1 Tax=uncultured Salegentibacter sp. TaxID=259320 RepID=UPI0025935039|nr:hypothetical protein [uncultured Salegentibacter sp.]
MKLTEKQADSIANYKRMGIYIAILSGDKVRISQNTEMNGYFLTQKQLVKRARAIFPDAKIIPLVYSLDVDEITADWIQAKMKDLGIKRNDLIKQLAIDKSSLSLYLTGKREMEKNQKAAFYYYFLTYELNRDLRT